MMDFEVEAIIFTFRSGSFMEKTDEEGKVLEWNYENEEQELPPILFY